MKKVITIATLLLPLLLSLAYLAAQQQEKVEVGIVAKLGQKIPMNLEFNDEKGQKVTIAQLLDKPTVLAFVYFRCPGICTPLLNGLKQVIDKVELQPGKDFRVLTISIDPSETHIVAAKKKANYLKQLKRPFPPDAWRFITGKQENIHKLTDATGFYYKMVGNEYRHAGTLIVLSPKGKISRYLYGLSFLPFDLQMALVEASEGRVGPTIAKFLRFCYSYDPQGKRYGLNILRIAGVIIVFMILVLVAVMIFGKKINKKES